MIPRPGLTRQPASFGRPLTIHRLQQVQKDISMALPLARQLNNRINKWVCQQKENGLEKARYQLLWVNPGLGRDPKS